MVGHLQAIRMHNIQSWGEESNVMNFEYEKINVIIARNETGKSVMFKVFRQMCFPSFFGRTGRKDLIKKNKEYGRADLLTSDGHFITFMIYQTTQKYILTNPEGEVSEWIQNELPEPIRIILGWYVDVEHHILLNIIDHEISMPLVETEASFNAKVLRFVVEHQQLEDSVKLQKEWVDRLKESLTAESNTLSILDNKISMIPRVDLNALEKKLEETEYLSMAVRSIDKVAYATNTYMQVLPPTGVEKPLNEEQSNELGKVMNGLKQLLHLEETLTDRKELVVPKFKSINENEYSLLKKTDTELHSMYLQLVNKYNHILEKPLAVLDSEQIKPVMKSRQATYFLDESMTKLLQNINNRTETETGLYYINKEIKVLEKELGVCPLCNKSFLDHKTVEGKIVHE